MNQIDGQSDFRAGKDAAANDAKDEGGSGVVAEQEQILGLLLI